MRSSGVRRSEWRQFRLLSRDATRRLLNSALFTRESDSASVALWLLALLTTPPLLFAVVRGMSYPFLVRARPAVVADTVLGDRLFFIVYGMLAALLVASLLWEALFPDRAEQEIVGVLPVHPRTLAAARLAAAIRIGSIAAVAIAVPAGAVFTLFSGGHPALRSIHTLLVGHVVGVTLASLFVFLSLLALRGLMAVTIGTRAGGWVATALQLVAIVALADVFLFLPKALDLLIGTLRTGGDAFRLPPLWFVSLISWLGGDGFDARPELAGLAVVATLCAALIVTAIYLLSATGIGRRVMEAQEHHRRNSLSELPRAVAAASTRRPCVRSVFLFTLASLSRSRQHLLILSGYASVALAVIVFRVVVAGMHRPRRAGPRLIDAAPERLEFAIGQLSSEAPTSAQLSIPLVLIFFLVLGMRACFRVPTDPAANWPFRLFPPSARDAARATWLSLLAIAVAPVAAVTAIAGVVFWSLAAALLAALTTFFTGVLLIELALVGWSIVPFTYSHEPSPDAVRWKWMVGLVALNAFAFGLASLQASALRSGLGTTWYLLAMGLAIAAASIRRCKSIGEREMIFDEAADETATLSLSEALN
ncbi:MAG: hypothetical protein LC791_05405 [Acidobacteria bacterium]|nr:hypothetical protein [Acidobacteriota bacterium]